MEFRSATEAALAALGHRGGGLAIGGVPARELVERFGSPLFVYDAAALRARIAAVRDAFGGRVGILLALKANPSLALARVARDAGAGAEVASAGEIRIAAAAGFDGALVQFSGPGKSDVDLDVALEAKARVNLESEREHARLSARARARGIVPEVAIRVNPNIAQGGSRLRMADASSRFGVDRERVPDLARAIVADGACRLVGLHQYGGSQSFDAETWVASAATLLAVARDVEQAAGVELHSLNLGGGFGWPVYDGDPVFDLTGAGRGVAELLDRTHHPFETHVELGRYLLAGGGVYLTRVVDAKQSGGRRQIVLDGGMHHFGAASGLGAVMRRAYSILHADRPDARESLEPVSLGGPLCTPADRIGKDLSLPHLEVGDVVAVLNAGAYGLTFSPTLFLGHPTPAEVLVDHGQPRVIRDRGSPEDALHHQRP